MAKKKSTKKKTTKVVEIEEPEYNYYDLEEEHRVFSHMMYILFLISSGFAAYYTFAFLTTTISASSDPSLLYLPVKALVFLGWAFLFKTFAHRIHVPHH